MGKMLGSRSSSHQYIVEQALKLINDNELNIYGSHIMAGALHEDYFFKPNETLENIMLGKEKQLKTLPMTKKELDLMVAGIPMESIVMDREKGKTLSDGFLPWIVRRGSELLRKLGVSQIVDPLNKPYMAHFYNPRKSDKTNQGLVILRGGLRFESSKKRAEDYWDMALESYGRGELWRAYLCLGHMAHLIEDMCVPAHVHNDPHGPTLLFGKLDSLEMYMIKPKFIFRPNIRKWKAKDVPKPELTPGWEPGPFMYRIAYATQMYRSVDGEGMQLDKGTIKYQFARFNQKYDEKFNSFLDQQRTGALSDDECRFQGCVLIPKAIFHSAELLLQFRQFAKNNPGPVTV